MRSKLRGISFFNWGLDKKLIFVYALMIVIPIIIVTFLGFQRYQEYLTERVSEFGLNLTDQISENLDNYIQQIDRLSMTFYLDGVDGLRGKPDPMNVYAEKIAVDRALRNIMFIIPFQDIEGIYWIREGEVQYSQYGYGRWIDHSSFKDEGWYDEVLAADGKGIIIPPYRPQFAHGLSATNATDEHYIFSYARSIVNVSNRVPYGVLLIDITTDNLYELLNDAKIKTSSTLFIVDDDGTIIYHPDTDYITSNFPPTLNGAYGKFIETYNDKGPMMIQYVRSDTTGWTVVNTVPLQQLSDELRIFRNILWILAGAALLLSVILSSAFTMTTIKPLKTLKRLMHKVEMGDYNVRIEKLTNDEVGQLGRGFNHMVEKINELVSRVLKMKIYQQQAEFKVLQSQINPHFLYNTLESISMKAEINQDYEVADMVSLLGKLFRLSLQRNSELIPLSREIEYVEVYMRLQHIRLPKMKYSISFEDAHMNTYTLPWIIQPIVENAIIHGIAPVKGQGYIRIWGERVEDDLIVYVEDNGNGMSEKRLAEVNESLMYSALEDEDGQHIGLYNVHRRILNSNGQGYGLKVQSVPGGGTIVTIRMKYSFKGETSNAKNDYRG